VSNSAVGLHIYRAWPKEHLAAWKERVRANPL